MSNLLKILFLSANPLDTPTIAVDEELRAIKGEIERSSLRSTIELTICPAARPLDLFRDLNREKPHVLHISSHGTDQGALVLTNEFGVSTFVKPSMLYELFSGLENPPLLVIMNSCYSYIQADEIARVVDVVIGLPGTVADDNAITFSQYFYMALSEGASVDSAFRQAITGVKCDHAQYWHGGEPHIIPRKGIDPRDVTLSGLISANKESQIFRRGRQVFRDRDAGRGFVKRDIRDLTTRMRKAGLVFFDVDGMGQINKQFGRTVGNRVLGQIMVLIEDNSNGVIACGRCGDDTFFCVLETDKKSDAIAFLKKWLTSSKIMSGVS